MADTTIFWHDYETTGSDPRRDRAAQFAGIRTNLALEQLGDPVVAWCRASRDVLPSPDAALVTRITPQRCEREGVIEAEFAARVHEQLAAPNTVGAGYNSIRFDDEVTRHLLYRNFHDPYAREWENGNARWDLIDLVRLCHALRPDGIRWPQRDGCLPSFRLEDLARENGLAHDRAHDALSDVHATLALARLIRTRQPRLFDWYFALRAKQRALELLDWLAMTPVLHASSRYPAQRGCIAVIAPIVQHPTQTNAVIAYDLDEDPTELIALPAEDIHDRVFTPRADLPEDVSRIPLKAVHANRSPALAPLSVLANVDHARIGLDLERALRHLEQLRAASGLREKLREVFARARGGDSSPEDADIALYSGGFLPDRDRALLREVRSTPPAALAALTPRFSDARCRELLFRYRARNWPDTLTAEEAEAWRTLRRARLLEGRGGGLSLAQFHERVSQLRFDGGDTSVLDALESWSEEITHDL